MAALGRACGRRDRRFRAGRGTRQWAGCRGFPARPEAVNVATRRTDAGSCTSSEGRASPTPIACGGSRPSLRRCRSPRVALVLSACRGVTDELIGLVAAAERARRGGPARPRSRGCRSGMLRSRRSCSIRPRARHSSGSCRPTSQICAASFRRSPSCARPAATCATSLPVTASCGRVGSSPRSSNAASKRGPVRWIDSRDIIVVEWGALGPGVQWTESQRTRRVGSFRRTAD